MNAVLNIVLVGCGKMGGSLLAGWQSRNIHAHFSVIDPHGCTFNTIDYFDSASSGAKALNAADIIVLAVKPQIIAKVCEDLSPHLSQNTLILSIAAGQSLNSLSGYFGNNQPVIRAMPNLPASIGKGMSVAVANPETSEEQKQQAHLLLETAGKIEWIGDESLLDPITALSGSGPAYVFYLIEALAAAGVKAGLPEELSQILARQTVIGSAALAEADSQTPASTLRENVTSPGGTTEAALKILMDGRIQAIFDEALKAAARRSHELSS